MSEALLYINLQSRRNLIFFILQEHELAHNLNSEKTAPKVGLESAVNITFIKLNILLGSLRTVTGTD